MNSKKEFKTGLFVVLILAAAFLTVNYLRGNGFLEKSSTFYTSYGDVQGLNPATPVYINGFKAGSITDMKYDRSRGTFSIKLNVSGEFDIPRDSRTEIYSSDILGGKSIRIIYGTSDKYASSGDTLSGTVCGDPLSDIMSGLSPVVSGIDSLVTNLNMAVKNINLVLNEETRADISSMVSYLNRTAENMESLTAGIKKRSPEIDDFILNLEEISASLKAASVRLDATLSNAQTISCDLKEAGLKEAIGHIDSLLIKLQDPDGTIGRMVTTDSLHNSVESLISDLDSLISKIKENPRKNLKFSVF